MKRLGRIRRSTVMAALVFAAALTSYILIRPAPTPAAPTTTTTTTIPGAIP